MKLWDRVNRQIVDHTIKISVVMAIVVLLFWIVCYPVFQATLAEYLQTVLIVNVAVMIGVGLLLLDYFSVIRKLIKPSEVKIHANQESADDFLRKFIDDKKPREAELLEFSAKTVFRTIIKPLADMNCSIRLLLENPNVVISRLDLTDGDRARICDSFARDLGIEIQNYDRIRIRFNTRPASLRGRRLGNKLVNVGWYTYDVRPDVVSEALYPRQIHGHDNPLLSVVATEENYKILEKMFKKVFNDLWKRAEKPKDICEVCEKRHRNECSIDMKWLERVSRD